jgi:glutamate racemase
MNRDGNGVATAGSTGDIYDRIARLLPEENREGFLKHVARIRDFHENDEILMLVEACGYFTLLSATVPERLLDVVRLIDKQARDVKEAAASITFRHEEGRRALEDTLGKYSAVLESHNAKNNQREQQFIAATETILKAVEKTKSLTEDTTRAAKEISNFEFKNAWMAIICTAIVFLSLGLVVGHLLWP